MLERTPAYILDRECEPHGAGFSSAAENGDGLLLDAFSQTVSGVVERVGPAVVRVEAKFDRHNVRRGIGPGVLISPDGLVLTNSHVVQGARDMLLATPDGLFLEARL